MKIFWAVVMVLLVGFGVMLLVGDRDGVPALQPASMAGDGDPSPAAAPVSTDPLEREPADEPPAGDPLADIAPDVDTPEPGSSDEVLVADPSSGADGIDAPAADVISGERPEADVSIESQAPGGGAMSVGEPAGEPAGEPSPEPEPALEGEADLEPSLDAAAGEASTEPAPGPELGPAPGPSPDALLPDAPSAATPHPGHTGGNGAPPAGSPGGLTPADAVPAVAVDENGVPAGLSLLDGRFTVAGEGTAEDPLVVPWQLLVAARESYNPRIGQTDLPGWVESVQGKHVRITGFLLAPVVAMETTEMLVMMNQWDGCCIGVPPTPYDAIEIKLLEALPLATVQTTTYGAIEGVLDVDPYLYNDWLLGLYIIRDARLARPTP